MDVQGGWEVGVGEFFSAMIRAGKTPRAHDFCAMIVTSSFMHVSNGILLPC